MKSKRLKQTIGLNMQRGAFARGNYLREKGILGQVGKNVRFQPRLIPLYPELIRFHNNVMVGAGVRFVTHDAIHVVLNGMNIGDFSEKVGCIEVLDNVFIGSDSTIMPNVRIGENVIIGANSLVVKDCESNSVYAGVPAKRIGSFDDYVKRRKNEKYPVVKKNQKISEDEISAAWNAFMIER